MNKDKNDKHESSTGISIGKSYGNTFSNVDVIGYGNGIIMDEAYNTTFNSINIIGLQALKVIKETQILLSKIKLDEKLQNDINIKLKEIETAPTKESATSTYMKLISSLSDHVTVLTPIWPHLCILAGSLIA
ncbi:hypothetical protein EV102420_38_00240 [Pseudescherichia vulneris NBRC 102420]|uniref:Uncharacterized protein n=1 Tax=Pseudescherichia vulneris NBRC 102420 TaxID=1115515 RepID=A0A090V6I8_PSEVU|nr:hypothetical protein [Pseudescherichia vulneris]GAL60421.1 hypothetical protein EV102420_38_00240 [Pseudescherichia vulneris NBRC 102420]STQ60133.1 Uncharacterised protein [Pseudescherichia vulneris]